MHNNDTQVEQPFAFWRLGDETEPGKVATYTPSGELTSLEELSPDEDGDDGLRRLGYRRADAAKWTEHDYIRDTYAVDIRPL